MTRHDARLALKRKYGIDDQMWYRLLREQRALGLGGNPPATVAPQAPQAPEEPAQEPTQELIIPSGLSGEAKDAFNRALEMINAQSGRIMTLSAANESLMNEVARKTNTIKFLKGVARDMLDAVT